MGQKTEVAPVKRHVPFTLKSGDRRAAPACPKSARSGHALFLKLGACLPSSIVPAIVNSNIKSWADAQRQPAPRARWLSSFGRRCGRSGN
jgi:hypothetical protein